MKSISYGVKWNGIGKATTQISVILGSLFLSRVLLPEDFGTVAMVTIIYSYAVLFLDMGFTHALIQKKQITNNELSSVFWLNTLIGLFFFSCFYLSAPLIASFYKNEDLVLITRVISTAFLLSALPQIPRVLLIRQMEFKKTNIVNILGVPLSYTVALIMAYNDFGMWSIVAQMLLSRIFGPMLLWSYIKWRPKIRLRIADLRGIMKFSLNTFLFQFIDHWTQNLNGILIGRNIGAVDMGLYNRSRVFLTLPVRNIASVITSSTFPKLAQLQDEKEQVKVIYLKSIHFLSFWIVPAMLGLSFIAKEFTLFFLGSIWEDMTPILQIFAVTSIMTSIFYVGDSAISSQGRIDLLVKLSFLEKGILIIGSFIGIQFGLMGVVYANLIGTILVTVPKFMLLNRVLTTSLKDHITIHLPIILKSLIMLGMLFLAQELLEFANSGVLLFVYLVVGITSYLVINLVTRDPILAESMKKVKNLLSL